MARSQAAIGHKVTIVATDYRVDELPNVEEVEIHLYHCQFSSWRLSIELARALPILMKDTDIVHIHMMWEYPTYVAAKICKKLKRPYILRPCGMLDRWSLSRSAWKKKPYLSLIGIPLIRNAAGLHFTTREELKNSSCFDNEVNAFIVPNGLSPDAFVSPQNSLSFRKRFPELEDKRIVLFLGRLHYKKQPDVVLEAFKLVCDMDVRLTLVLAGPSEPAYLNNLRQLAKKLGVADRVIFTGLLQGMAVREALYAAEVFVLPSLQENFCIAVAEAMAAGCPVIVSEQVNLASEIRENNAGIVCQSDTLSFAAALETLIRDSDLRTSMGMNGRQLVLGKFTWQRAAVELISVYQNILSSTRTSTAWSQTGFTA
jgi:glycosyltransferase involved in cell wall biosynthesis